MGNVVAVHKEVCTLGIAEHLITPWIPGMGLIAHLGGKVVGVGLGLLFHH